MLTYLQLSILAIFADDPGRELSLSEIGDLLGKRPGVFQKGINALEREGWVSSRRRGNLRLFRVNAEHPLFSEMGALVRKGFGAEALLKGLVGEIPGVKTALIYGSYAKGRLRAGSDIDLLVAADDGQAEDKLVSGLAKVEKKLLREVNYKFYSVDDFRRRLKGKDPFLGEVLSEKYILLKGAV